MDYLVHHGILGMKWGIRRYQNKDGTLTPAGQKRYNKLQGEINKLTNNGKAKPRSASEMSNEELNTRIERLGLEKKYISLMNEMYPPAVKKPNLFANTFNKIMSTTLPEIANNAMQKLGNKMMENYLSQDKFKSKEQLDAEKKKRILDDAKWQNDYYDNLNKAKKNKAEYEGKQSEWDTTMAKAKRINDYYTSINNARDAVAKYNNFERSQQVSLSQDMQKIWGGRSAAVKAGREYYRQMQEVQNMGIPTLPDERRKR